MSSLKTDLIGRRVKCCAPIAYNEKHAGETGIIRSVVADENVVVCQVEWPDGSLSTVNFIDGKRFRLEPKPELLQED